MAFAASFILKGHGQPSRSGLGPAWRILWR